MFRDSYPVLKAFLKTFFKGILSFFKDFSRESLSFFKGLFMVFLSFLNIFKGIPILF